MKSPDTQPPESVSYSTLLEQMQTRHGIVIYPEKYADYIRRVGWAVKSVNKGGEKTTNRYAMEGGIELLFRSPKLELAPDVQQLLQEKPDVIPAAMGGDTAFLLLLLVRLVNLSGESYDTEHIKIMTSYSALGNVIYPIGSDRSYTRQRINKLLNDLLTVELGIMFRELDNEGVQRRTGKLEIVIPKVLVVDMRFQYYRVSVLFLSVIAGLPIAIAENAIDGRIRDTWGPGENQIHGRTLSILRRIYVYLKRQDDFLFRGTVKAVARIAGEEPTRVVCEAILKAFQILKSRGILAYTLNKETQAYTLQFKHDLVEHGSDLYKQVTTGK